ncbi:MAG: LysR family transcriptional regulator [Bacteroidales bacterium]|nr:LysR family transcriptional regulator [Bacteroidales bacterium]
MEIKHLRLVKNIVELGSIAKSKDKLCLTQSALSYQLKEAEMQAGTTLFVRSNKKLILTAAGELVYKSAADILARIDELDRGIREISRGEKGIIRICTACFTYYYWFPALVKKFSELHPQVDIKIYPEYTQESIQKLQSHDLDAVIINRPEPCKNIRFFEIMNDEMVAIVPPNHEFAKRKFIRPTDFEGKNLIIFSKPVDTVFVYSKVLRPNGIKLSRIYEVPMTEAMIEMVASNIGIAVIPSWIAKPYVELGKIATVRVTSKGLYRSLGLAFLEKANYPIYYKTLIEFLKENLVDTAAN